MPSVSVVILCWNGKRFLEKFLPSVLLSGYAGLEVVVADNASTDGSAGFVREKFPSVRLIELNKNAGFAEGYNLALQQVRADYYVLLNQDVEVAPGWLQPLVACMESNKRIAACQPKILSYHEKNKFEYAGACGGYLDRYGYPFCRGRIFDTLEEDRGQYNSPADIFWSSGACMMIRSSVYHEMGGMDTDFFAHMEEIDLCWRIRNAGYRIVCEPRSVVYHVGGGSLPQGNPRKTYLNFRNNLVMLYKNLPEDRLWKMLFRRLLLDQAAAVRELLSLRLPAFFAIERAVMSFLLGLNRWKEKRTQVMRLKRADTIEGIYPGSVIFRYFLRGKRRFSDLGIG